VTDHEDTKGFEMAKMKLQNRPVTIAVPLAPTPVIAYVPLHIDVRLTHEQGLILKRLFEHLQSTGTRLAGGRYMQTPPDALRWLCEEIQRRERGQE
jgi:hypothetical protein